MLGVLWWAWAAYAWLTNTVDAEEGEVRLVVFGAMVAMLVASLAVPDVFGNDAFVFACAYAVVRIAHLALYAFAGRGDRDLLAAIARLSAGSLVAISLLFVASALDGPAQTAVWVIALACDFAGAFIGGGRGWRLEPGHFAERHGLIVIIAIGETIVALGASVTHDLGLGVITAAALGLAIAFALWWAYFDVVAIVAERRLREATGKEQLTMARDSYSYLHLPMIAGIILLAVGVKKTLADIGEPLATVPAVALCGGVALYLGAHILFRLRNVRTLSHRRLVVTLVLLASHPGRARDPRARDPRGGRRSLRRTDRLRGDPLRRSARAGPESGRGADLAWPAGLAIGGRRGGGGTRVGGAGAARPTALRLRLLGRRRARQGAHPPALARRGPRTARDERSALRPRLPRGATRRSSRSAEARTRDGARRARRALTR